MTDSTSWRRWVGDVVAAVPLFVLVAVLPARDGGWGLAGVVPLAAACLLAAPVAVSEARRLPRIGQWLTLAWSSGLGLALVVAVHRDAALTPLLTYTSVPIVLAATLRLLRRSWGPAALVLVLVITFGRYQYDAWLSWWGWADGGDARWAPLSWRNPSAALTGMFGVWFLGLALTTTRLLRVGAVLLAATGLAGTSLTGSRAGVAVTVGAVAVVAVLGLRTAIAGGRPWRGPVLVTASVVAGAALAVVALVSVIDVAAGSGSGATQPVAARTRTVATNATARIGYWEAAGRMFVDRPLVGHGPGSYSGLAFQWADRDVGVSSSAHNEYLQVAAEAGLLPTLALVGAAVSGAVLTLRRIRRPVPASSDPSDLTVPLTVGGAGALALLSVHMAVDFDWQYPTLPVLAALGMSALIVGAHSGATSANAEPEPAPSSADGAVGAFGLGLCGVLVAVGLIGANWQDRVTGATTPETATQAPWELAPHVTAALDLIRADQPERAREVIARTTTWNPAAPRPTAILLLARLESGDIDTDTVLATLAEHPTWVASRAEAYELLAELGYLDAAAAGADDLTEVLTTFTRTRVSGSRLAVARTHVRIAVAEGGCGAGWDAARTALRGDELPTGAADDLGALLAELGCSRA